MSDALAIVTDDRRGSLEDIAPRTHSRPHDWTRGMPPHIERASASREKKPPPPVAAKPVTAPAIVPPTIELVGRVLAIFGDYTGLQTAVRNRVDEFGITREQLDHLSGNQPGYSGKILGGKQVKKFGRQSLGNTLGAVGSYLVLIENPEQVAKLKAVIAALSALCDVAALGVTRKEFEQIAGFTARPKRSGIASLGAALRSTGCKMALVEDAEQTAKMMARTNKRKLPLRDLKLLPTAAKAQSHART